VSHGKKRGIKYKAFIAMSIIIISVLVSAYFILFYPAKLKPANYKVSPPKPSYELSDADGDGIINLVEIAYGTDPFDNDSDDDGIMDGTELLWNSDVDSDSLINALDQDSDNDMIPDSLEDKNKNGLVDVGETSVINFDTDSDGLEDGLEDANLNGVRDINETDPLVADTDNDGLLDGSELNWFEDADGDGLINALDPDSDNDLLLDGLEVDIGSNPLSNDTDSDLVPDGIEYYKGLNVTNPDTDGDFLIDGEEAVIDSYWVEAENYPISSTQLEVDEDAFNDTALQSLSDGSIMSSIVFRNISAGVYKLFIRTKCVFASSSNPGINIIVKSDSEVLVSENHLLPCLIIDYRPVSIYRWISTTSFSVSSGSDLFIELSTSSGDVVFVDMLFLIKVDTINFHRTNPLLNDSDGDGLLDGIEAPIDAYWWEAEDFVYDSSQIIDIANMSNGKGVVPLPDSKMCFISDENYIYGAGPYALFVRAAKMNLGNPTVHAILNVSIIIDYGASVRIINGNADVWGDYPRGRWTVIYFNNSRYQSFFYLPESAMLSINVTLYTSAEPVIIDKFALLSIWYNRSRFGPYIYDYDPVPRVLDPLDPDTDGDQYRIINGTLENSAGYLTDGFEWSLGMNPFDLDTDNDGLRNGTAGYPFTDDIDPNPLSDDSDGDGLFDWLEDRNANFEWDPNYGETNLLDKDTDDDGILDSNEDWNYDGLNDIYETDPLDNDTDDDGLLDGFELRFIDPQGGADTANWPDRDLVNKTFYISDPLDWDSDDDGLPDGWIDFNKNGKLDLGEFEDRDCDGLLYIGAWNNGSGPGETNPWYRDTDFDGLSDYEEIIERHSDPISPQLPDLSIMNVSTEPSTPIIYGAMDFISVSFDISLTNLGEVKAPRTIHDGPNLILRLSIIEIKDNGNKTLVEFDLSLSSFDPNDSKLIQASCNLAAGVHQLVVMVYGYYQKYYYMERALEIDYLNNVRELNITVKGPPTAHAESSSSYAVLNDSGMAEIYFYGWGEDPDNEIVYYAWDFDGDGVFDWVGNSPENVSFVFTKGGYYVSLFEVVDEDGFVSNVSLRIVIIDPKTVDTDGDGLSNAEEKSIGTDPYKADSDSDGLSDKYEFDIGSNPLANDSDNDTLLDYYECLVMGFYGIDPLDRKDADNDNVINILDDDSDDDGLMDGEEIKCIYEYWPENPNSWFGTNPFSKDSDYDNISDYDEIMTYGTNPQSSDTDNDGLKDFDEIFLYLTDPLNMDCDNDRVPDGYDLQPLIPSYIYQLWNVYPRGMIRESSIVSVFGLTGEAWRSTPIGWEKISANNVKSSVINENTVRNWSWGTYYPDIIDLVNITSVGYIDGYSDTSPNYYVKYTFEKYCYNVTFINPRATYVGGFPFMFTPITLSENFNGSIVLQLTLNQDRTSFCDYGFIALLMTYKLYRYEDVVLSGNNIIEVNDYPVYWNYSFAMHVNYKTYRVSFTFPKQYSGSRYILCIQPAWYYHWGKRNGLDPIPSDLFKITGAAIVMKGEEKTLIYGIPDLKSLDSPIPYLDYLDPSSHDNGVRENISILEYKDEKYYVKEISIGLYVTLINNTHIVLKTYHEKIIGSTPYEDLLNRLMPDELKKARYSPLIKWFKNVVSEAISRASDKKSVAVCESITKMLAVLKYTYDGQVFPFEAQVALFIGGEFLDPENLELFVKLSKSTTKTLERASIVFEIVTAAIEISVLIYRASQTSDRHMQTYYAFRIMFIMYEKMIEIALTIALPGIGAAIVFAWEMLKLCVPQIEEAIDALIRYMVSEWEALTGTVPEEFARRIFRDACNKVINLVEHCAGLSIPVLPTY